jgi:hypothetical protein
VSAGVFLRVRVEQSLVGSGYLGIPASPLQLAIARAADGESIAGLLSDDEAKRYLGMVPDGPLEWPSLNVIVGGVRGGKSTLAEAAAIAAVYSADLSRLKPWQTPRFVIVGPTVDAASATFNELVGAFEASAVLRKTIVGQPKDGRLTIRRPDGRKVELAVVPATQGGASVRNRWLVGFVIEEAAQIGAEEDGQKVNLEGMLRAARTRLLPGCAGWVITSPMGANGEVWRLFKTYFGKGGQVRVWHAPTRALNPSFPQEQIDAARAENPDVAAREFDAEWLDPDSVYLGAALVDPARREAPLYRPVPSGRFVCAAIDPATRGNSWTLCLAWGEPGSNGVRVVVAGCWEWTGSKLFPLKPKSVFQEIAGIVGPYGVRMILSDNFGFDGFQGDARDAGLDLREVPFGEREAAYTKTKSLLSSSALELPPGPDHVRADLIAVRQRLTSSGPRIVLPHTPDGRHTDFAPSITLAVAEAERTARSHAPIDWDFIEACQSVVPPALSFGGDYKSIW